jgi:threonine synthase
MKFYSTNNKNLTVDLRRAVTEGLAPDNGLYMPVEIPRLPDEFFRDIAGRSFREIGFEVSRNLLRGDIPDSELRKIVDHTIQFDAPIVKIEEKVHALELFYGPTLAFKDFGARFMSQLLGYFARQQEREIIILVATSGDTGSAVANGFLGVPGTKVVVLYPAGKVSEIQEKQFTTLQQNVTALEVSGTFDDCQRLVKEAFLDRELRNKFFLTSANSINIARLIPQSFYYFYAFAQLKSSDRPVVFSIPSGNFGNITAGLFAMRMGLPIDRFIAATNINDVVPDYLKTGTFKPRPSSSTISNAMDVGNPSNFYRMLELFNGNFVTLSDLIKGYSFTDSETADAMRNVYAKSNYIMDPHGAVGYLGLKKYLKESGPEATGIFLETAHPSKFKEVVDETLGRTIDIHPKLMEFMKRKKQTIQATTDFAEFKRFLMTTC